MYKSLTFRIACGITIPWSVLVIGLNIVSGDPALRPISCVIIFQIIIFSTMIHSGLKEFHEEAL